MRGSLRFESMNGVAQGVGIVFRAWQGVSGPASPTVRFVVILRMCYRSEGSENGRRRGKYSEPRAYRSWGSARSRRCRDLGPTQRVRRASWFFSGADAGVVGARVAAEQCGRCGAGERRHGGAKSLRGGGANGIRWVPGGVSW